MPTMPADGGSMEPISWVCEGCGTTITEIVCPVCGLSIEDLDPCDGCEAYVPGSSDCSDCEMMTWEVGDG